MSRFFSVIIPVFNRPELLRRTLRSLAGQTLDHKLFTVIVVDDGSTVPLEPVVKSFNDRLNVRYIRQENQGPGVARNTGAQAASTEWLALLDSDVIADPYWLEWGYNLLFGTDQTGLKKSAINLKKVGALEGRTIADYPSQQILADYGIDPSADKETNVDRSPFTHQTENTTGGKYPTCNFFVRKTLCNFYTGYRRAFREDSDLAFGIIDAGYDILFRPELIIYHPPLPGNIWTPIKLAGRYEYDGLLKARYPEHYKTLDRHTFAGISISQLRKKIYALYIVSFVFLSAWLGYFFVASSGFLGANVQWPHFLWTVLAAAPFAGSYTLVYLLHARGTKLNFMGGMQLIRLMPVVFFVPFVLYRALLKGFKQFKHTPTAALSV